MGSDEKTEGLKFFHHVFGAFRMNANRTRELLWKNTFTAVLRHDTEHIEFFLVKLIVRSVRFWFLCRSRATTLTARLGGKWSNTTLKVRPAGLKVSIKLLSRE